MRVLALAVTLLTVFLFQPCLSAESVSIDDVEVGFSGHYKAGQWSPVRVAVAGLPAGDAFVVETETIDADGSTLVRREPARRSEAEDTTQLSAVFQAGRMGSPLTVRVLTADGTTLAESALRSDTDELPNGMTDREALSSATQLPQREDESESTWSEDLAIVPLTSALPENALAYQAVDVLIISGGVEANEAASEALRTFVADGGRLVLSLGETTPEFEAGPLHSWIPINTNGMTQLRRFSDLESYAKARQRLPGSARVQIAAIESVAETLTRWEDRILVGRSPYGFGDVTVVAFDIEQPTFRNWTGLPLLLERAVIRDHDRLIQPPSESTVNDLATQLLNAEDEFPKLNRVSVGQILLLLLAYAVVVGPLDYLIVHRWLGRPALTWITLPLIVVGVCWWLHWWSVESNGRQSQYNELTIIDHDVESGFLRGESIVTLYASEAGRTNITCDSTSYLSQFAPLFSKQAGGTGLGSNARLSWLAAPEESFGGIYRDAAGGLFRPEYTLTGGTQSTPAGSTSAEDVPLLAWASRQFGSSWKDFTAKSPFEANLTTSGRGLLEGTLQHQLAVPVTSYIVAFGNQVYVPYEDEWAAGQALDLGSNQFTRRDLRALLANQRQVTIEKEPGATGSEFFNTEDAYDRRGTDAIAIARMMSFHEVAGGRTYTKLDNSLWKAMELSPLLDLGRAVVWMELDSPGPEVTIEPERKTTYQPERQKTIVRVVVPVTPSTNKTVAPLVEKE